MSFFFNCVVGETLLGHRVIYLIDGKEWWGVMKSNPHHHIHCPPMTYREWWGVEAKIRKVITVPLLQLT